MDRLAEVFGKLAPMTRGLTLAFLLFGAVAVAAQQVNVTTLGPQVGDQVTDFRLMDQNGEARTIAGAAGPKGTMVVFFRSADW